MGQEAGCHKGIHIAGIRRKLQVGHIGTYLAALGIGLVAENHGIGTGKGGVADIPELFQLHIREHTDIHRIFHIDSGADAAGNIDLVDHVYRHIHALQKRIDGGENRALGTDKVVNIHFIDADLPSGFGLLPFRQHVAAHAVPVPLHPAAFPEESETGREVSLNEVDIDNFIRAKGAIFSAIDTLLQSVDMTPDCIDKVYVAGGIGSGINMKNAVNIGMFPDVELEKFQYIGNSSLTGAYAMVVSDEANAKCHEVAANMTYLELSTYPGYMDSFVAACVLPHTDRSLFPHSVQEM